MTKEKAKELLPIIEAFANGKEVEYFNGYEWTTTWHDTDFSDNSINYRIKSEQKLVPFTFEDDAENIIGKAIRSKSKDVILLIQVVNNKNVMLHGFDTISFYCLLQNWEFLDGSPCGKYIVT